MVSCSIFVRNSAFFTSVVFNFEHESLHEGRIKASLVCGRTAEKKAKLSEPNAS